MESAEGTTSVSSLMKGGRAERVALGSDVQQALMYRESKLTVPTSNDACLGTFRLDTRINRLELYKIPHLNIYLFNN